MPDRVPVPKEQGKQHVLDDGERVYGTWLPPEEEVNPSLGVACPGPPPGL
jgi:hypothetical protein